MGPDERVLDVAPEASTCGVFVGLPGRVARVRCPEALFLDADVAHCRTEFEALLELLEFMGPLVEPHDLGAAYVDFRDLVRCQADAVGLCKEVGRAVRKEFGELLCPALGWDHTKFTTWTAARQARPGHLLAVDLDEGPRFLAPLPVVLLPLEVDSLQRLEFLGLRTLGQYAILPAAAILQQFGKPGVLALRCARGEDDRPVVPRWQQKRLTARCEVEGACNQERLLALLRRLISPRLLQLRQNWQVCGQMRLTLHFSHDRVQDQLHRFTSPTADESRIVLTLEQLLLQMDWQEDPLALEVLLENLQDVTADQLSLFPAETERERKLHQVQRNLAARFGSDRLRRAVLTQPGAPLPEWRVGWLTGS
jgi:nucleotidyltransferase/DNA polymerase involved in DNA repair